MPKAHWASLSSQAFPFPLTNTGNATTHECVCVWVWVLGIPWGIHCGGGVAGRGSGWGRRQCVTIRGHGWHLNCALIVIYCCCLCTVLEYFVHLTIFTYNELGYFYEFKQNPYTIINFFSQNALTFWFNFKMVLRKNMKYTNTLIQISSISLFFHHFLLVLDSLKLVSLS